MAAGLSIVSLSKALEPVPVGLGACVRIPNVVTGYGCSARSDASWAVVVADSKVLFLDIHRIPSFIRKGPAYARPT